MGTTLLRCRCSSNLQLAFIALLCFLAFPLRSGCAGSLHVVSGPVEALRFDGKLGGACGPHGVVDSAARSRLVLGEAAAVALIRERISAAGYELATGPVTLHEFWCRDARFTKAVRSTERTVLPKTESEMRTYLDAYRLALPFSWSPPYAPHSFRNSDLRDDVPLLAESDDEGSGFALRASERGFPGEVTFDGGAADGSFVFEFISIDEHHSWPMASDETTIWPRPSLPRTVAWLTNVLDGAPSRSSSCVGLFFEPLSDGRFADDHAGWIEWLERTGCKDVLLKSLLTGDLEMHVKLRHEYEMARAGAPMIREWSLRERLIAQVDWFIRKLTHGGITPVRSH